MSQPILRTDDLTIKFGGITAVDRVSIHIKQGQIFGLIGPNGAGKTTMFNLLTGIYKPTAGKIYFKGKDITSLKTHEIVSLGISRTFQNIRLLKGHTVFQNVLLATHHKLRYSFVDALFMLMKFRQSEQQAEKLVNDLMSKYNLSGLRDEIASDLPQGLQRKVEIVRALATGAELIFLDEPAAGLNPAETAELMQLIRQLRDEGNTIFLIEHDMKLVKGICDEIAVLHFGQLLDQGTYEKVTGNQQVVQAYLGRRYKNAQS
ncbi:ABC transporter ATP-binding protein [Effusibacillus lacus]|uniref:ABC transporter ATP-binding protein n=1 Tax=Effusibacillus lacus TaxID=1348429 RepID=A0A292YLQ9_9BACL|nr:ABC transporter ATP-binding protein [Effusibacillus lacus]TCS72563.1 branched-chain amino acid transport system ATP-binding protein [Effusibacillus lacus]GAX90878.1 ABC transporter ATP-binding protein [Effusibacillus lacus]